MLPDDFDARVSVPVKVVDGRPQYFYGDSFPLLRDGAIGELILRRSAVLDPGTVRKLMTTDRVLFQPKGSTLRVEVNTKTPDLRVKPITSEEFIPLLTGNGFVDVVLKEDLFLTLRATKKATLRPCRVRIPVLGVVSRSLNESYSRIAQELEPWRRSSSGNVFRKMFYWSSRESGRNMWQPLDRLRFRLECEFEQRVFNDSMKGDGSP